MITPLSEALAERGFDKLTPVQEAVIAPDVATSDLLVSAQTGSGKTVGFGLAIAPTLLGDEVVFGPAAEPLALVVAPTRELAFQVKRELAWLYARTGAVVASCVGGMDMRDERRALDRGAHIVVGTPGRLRDHIERGSLDLSGLRVAILDEADEMLDLGFREDLEFILGAAPEDRRTLLFSATVPPTIAKLAQKFQRDARRINTLSGTEQHADISYQALRVAAPDSEHAIFNLLRFHHDESAIVFANTRAAVNHLTARLSNRGLAVVSLSGELSQSERSHALQAMRDGRARVCVATDVAARGIDLPNLNLVIHADLPSNTEGLLHRSGRTGRAGRKGISALIVPPKAVNKAERLLKWAKISAEWTVAPSAEGILRQDEERLLSDPAWNEPLTEAQTDFAAKLLALHSPEVIAAAYLRLYRSRHAAPEELLPPDTKPAARADRDFGPSRWIALSAGHKDRAEARWLLPLLCRAGNLDKSAIGAIRVQDSETFVELSEASVEGFMAALGADGVLEKGIAARLLDSAPDLSPQRRGPRPDAARPRAPRAAGTGDKPRNEGAPRRAPAPAPAAPVTPAAPVRDEVRSDAGPSPKPEGKKKPRHSASPAAAKPRAWTEDKPAPEKRKASPGKPAGKTAGKFEGKPAGKPAHKPKDKPKGKPSASPGDARDVSKRFSPKGAGKGPGKAPGKPRKPGAARPGGFDTPRRGKR
ncbi:DEAD/DEAH box helicase [Antarcticimicrobium luteum]|uniref:DEAD/DEAH box helicase n=1 Tax=Antarcticimicrobium luteum TaxID=2547397 RepID=A0A4R5V7T9_9RHOB|nr:DEAD/DEAH box helicase [Antarcticimicrobium luteum]TDK48100.1 DEAD/DEAH box helicase [Antarcticimicrobium luteum]